MFRKLSIIILALLSSFACTFSPQTAKNSASVTPKPTSYVFDKEIARDVSDSMVNALIKNDRPVIFAAMEKSARDYYSQESFNEIVDKMVNMFGSPMEAKFTKAGQGRKLGANGYDKPMLKHWYKVRTSNFEYGSHYIFVEIVPDGDGYASSGISIVNFPLGVSDDMR